MTFKETTIILRLMQIIIVVENYTCGYATGAPRNYRDRFWYSTIKLVFTLQAFPAPSNTFPETAIPHCKAIPFEHVLIHPVHARNADQTSNYRFVLDAHVYVVRGFVYKSFLFLFSPTP